MCINDPDSEGEWGPGEWEQQAKAFRDALRMAWDDTPWTGSHQLVGVKRLPRNLHNLDVVFAQTMVANNMDREASVKGLFSDLSQNLKRSVWSKRGVAKTLCHETMLYSFERDRLLIPQEHFLLREPCGTRGYPAPRS